MEESRSIKSFNVLLRRVLLLSLLTLCILVYFIFSNIKFDELLTQINMFWFFILVLNMISVFLVNGLKLKMIVKLANGYIDYRSSLRVVLSSVFASNITPYYSGGIAVQVYLLRKFSKNLGESTLISASYLILTVIVSIIFAILFLLIPHEFLAGLRKNFFYGIIILFFILSSLALFFMKFPNYAKGAIKFLSKRFNIKVDEERIDMEFNSFSNGLNLMLRNPVLLLILILISFLSQLLNELIGLSSLKMIDLSFNIREAFLTQIASQFASTTSFTPGGIGVVEGIYSVFFLPIAKNYTPMLTFLFRMFSFYIPSIIGGVVFYKTIGITNHDFLYK